MKLLLSSVQNHYRYHSSLAEHRLCLLRELGETENEVHVLFGRPVYEDVSNVLFNEISFYVDFFWLGDCGNF